MDAPGLWIDVISSMKACPFWLVTECIEREFFADNLLVRIHFVVVMIRWTGLAPWEFEFPFPGSLTCTFLVRIHTIFPPFDQLSNARCTLGGGAVDRRVVECRAFHPPIAALSPSSRRASCFLSWLANTFGLVR